MPHPKALTAKVYETLNALCANWATTAPLTAGTTVVQSAGLLWLDISLETMDDMNWDNKVYGDGES
uniref:Uncharacterized protein n=1 Tax=Moniliophthora roreri TaxID=221103 RepID=A0A0W0FSR9_MONRR